MQKNIVNLQILRAIAATLVVYYHIVGIPIHLGPLPNFGSFGVDIFFCLSGFVIAMLAQNGEKPTSFIRNRFIRVAPIYWIFTSFVMLIALIKPELLSFTSANWENYFKSIFFIPYFKESGSMHPMLAVGWTLNYEMLFYALAALALYFSQKYFITITTLFIVFIYLFFNLIGASELVSKFFGNIVLLEFVFGLLIYHAWSKNKFNWLSQPIAIVLFFTSLLSLMVIEVNTLGINRTVSFGIPAAVLLISTLRLEGILNKNSKITKALCAMGDASYATYVSHYFVVISIKKIFDEKLHIIDAVNPFGVAVGLILSLIAGQIIFILLDNPINKSLRKLYSYAKSTKPQKGSTERAFLKKA